jgi:hypothetical protein
MGSTPDATACATGDGETGPRRERTGHALHLPAPASPYAILLLRPHTRLATACSRVEAAHTHHEAARGSAGPDRATGVFLNILTSRPRGPLVDVSYIKPVKRTVRLSPHVKYVGLGTREVLSGPIRSLSTSFIRPARAHAAPARHAHWHRTAHPAVHQHQRNPGKTCVRRPGFTFSHLSESVSLTATGVLVVHQATTVKTRVRFPATCEPRPSPRHPRNE